MRENAANLQFQSHGDEGGGGGIAAENIVYYNEMIACTDYTTIHMQLL